MQAYHGSDGEGGAATEARFNVGYIWMISVVAALGGLLFGYDWVVIGGAKPFYEPYFNLTSEAMIGWAVSCALLGCLIGSVLSGVLSDRIGRKKLLILSGFLFGVSSILTGWSDSFQAFVLWRIVGGVAIGVASNVSPTYIAEVSPAVWRGRLVTLNQLTVVVGILGAQVINLLIAGHISADATHAVIRASWEGQYGWRWMFTAVAAPSALFLVFSFLIPESPRWLIKVGATDKARLVLTRIGGAAYAQAELSQVQSTLDRDRGGQASWKEMLRPAVLGVLLTGIGLAVLQQWSGTNVIFNYAEEIYRGAGYNLSGLMFNIVITGAINLVFTVLAIVTVDRFGRRALMLWGAGAIAVLHGLLGLAFFLGLKGPIVLGLTLAVIAVYALSLAPVTWVLLSEIFPNRIRGVAMSIAVSCLWIACFILTFTFPILNKVVGAAGSFWCYGVVCVAGFLLIALRVPETKGKTLEQIELELFAKG